MRRAAQEKQKAEDEEAAKWMSMISVEQTVRQQYEHRARTWLASGACTAQLCVLQRVHLANSAVHAITFCRCCVRGMAP